MQLPVRFQVTLILIAIYTSIVQPILTSVAANLITPRVEEYLAQPAHTTREKIKAISKLRIENADLHGLRFVIRDHASLRARPRIKASLVANLEFGQVVTVLSKDRKWVEIVYQNERNEPVQGWLLARHTRGFKN